MFERYLVVNGHLDFDFEKLVDGSNRPPDYTIAHRENTIFLDVKEFEPDDDRDLETGTGGSYDPYQRVRGKIHKLKEKFKDDAFERHCCCGVLCTPGITSDVQLDQQSIMIPAMLGNETINIPLDGGDPYLSLGKGGKMLHRGEPQNTTISALITLRLVRVVEYRLERRMNRNPKSREAFSLREHVQEAPEALSLEVEHEPQPAVIVWENPFARHPLPRDIFSGPYDSRWEIAIDGTKASTRRIYVGTGLQLIEQERTEKRERAARRGNKDGAEQVETLWAGIEDSDNDSDNQDT